MHVGVALPDQLVNRESDLRRHFTLRWEGDILLSLEPLELVAGERFNFRDDIRQQPVRLFILVVLVLFFQSLDLRFDAKRKIRAE